MSQQFGIMIMIDVKAALKTRCLNDHVYLIDNMKDFGSQNEGTNALVSKVNGTYWGNGSQNGEDIMNWLALDINDLPRTVQKTTHFNSLLKVASKGVDRLKESGLLRALEIKRQLKGVKVKSIDGKGVASYHPVINKLGGIIENLNTINEEDIINPPPIITAIKPGVGVKNIFPAQYESPNFVNNGWYWCAAVTTDEAGVFNYTVDVTLFDFVKKNKEEEAHWKPVQMSFDASILISREAMKSGFTNKGDQNYYLNIK